MTDQYEDFVRLFDDFEDKLTRFNCCEKSLENNEQTYEFFDQANTAYDAVLSFVRDLVQQNKRS